MKHPLPILLYHHVNDSGEGGATRPADFAAQMRWLADGGYRSVRLDELEAALLRGLDLGPRRFLLSFDDGSADLRECAGLLQACGFSAVAFLITAKVGTPGRFLAWEDLPRLQAAGFEFQSHSHTHTRWPLDATGENTLAAELETSRTLLMQHLGSSAGQQRHLAWPWGRCTAAFEQRARHLGYDFQYLVQRGAVVVPGLTLRLPRLGCDGMSPARLALWMRLLSHGTGARLCNAAFGSVRRARQGIGYTGLALADPAAG